MLQNVSLFAIARLHSGLPIIHRYRSIFDEFFHVPDKYEFSKKADISIKR